MKIELYNIINMAIVPSFLTMTFLVVLVPFVISVLVIFEVDFILFYILTSSSLSLYILYTFI